MLIANNKIKNWDEVEKLASCSGLQILLMTANPIYTAPTIQGNWPNVVRRAPQLESLDGVLVSAQVRTEAEAI